MALSKKPYKGTRDLFPQEKRVQDYLFSNMKKTAEIFGYESYDGPLLEEVELYKAKSGEELINEQIYSFNDRGDRFVAIRPEMTPTLARMVAQIHKESARPLRWFSIPNLMRYERPQKGRLREHWQFNCDIFGAPKNCGEVEIIQVAIHFLNNLGATDSHFEILINDREIVDKVFTKTLGLNEKDCYKLYKIVDQSKKVSSENLHKMISELPLSSGAKDIFNEYLALTDFDSVLSFLNKHGLEEEANNFKNFISQIYNLGLNSYLKYDPTIVRGLDYYTGIVFEIYDKHPDNRRAICGGGSYANLLKIFNEQPLPGVGMGLGDVTLKDFLTVHKLLPDLSTPCNDIFISFQESNCFHASILLAKHLRKMNVKTITGLSPVKTKKAFSLAEKKGARFIALMGEEELQNNSVKIKNLATKEDFVLDTSDTEKIFSILMLKES